MLGVKHTLFNPVHISVKKSTSWGRAGGDQAPPRPHRAVLASALKFHSQGNPRGPPTARSSQPSFRLAPPLSVTLPLPEALPKLRPIPSPGTAAQSWPVRRSDSGSAPPRPRPHTVSVQARPLSTTCVRPSVPSGTLAPGSAEFAHWPESYPTPPFAGSAPLRSRHSPALPPARTRSFLQPKWSPQRLGRLEAHDGFDCFRSFLFSS